MGHAVPSLPDNSIRNIVLWRLAEVRAIAAWVRSSKVAVRSSQS